MKKLTVIVVLLAFAIGVFVLAGRPHEVSVVHPDLFYTVTDVSEDSVMCVSEAFYLWPWGGVRATARLSRDAFPMLNDKGSHFRVWRPLGNHSPYKERYIHHLYPAT
jgi:hypothetical protein